MPTTVSHTRLNRVAQAHEKDFKAWKEGVSLESFFAKPIDRLLAEAAADRWRLSYIHRRHANKLFLGSPSEYRCAVSRYYYSMYHAMRSCVFISNGGDDWQEHSVLPLHIPSDFDSGVDWQNKLKNARLSRNRADYEVHPKSDLSWRASATTIKEDADLLLVRAKAYLLAKGCTL